MNKSIVVGIAVALGVAGCTDVDVDSGPGAAASDSTGAASEGTADASDAVDNAVTDFAAYVNVDPGEVEVVVDEQVTWRDGSLGCPDPDTGYTQEAIEGYQIVLRADGQKASYHGREGMPPFYCADPNPDSSLE